MKYVLLADTYLKIEETTKRLVMIDYLVKLLQETPKELLSKVIYLTQGKLYPDFIPVKLGMAEKMVMRSIAIATGLSGEEITKHLHKTGDLGETVSLELKKIARDREATLGVVDVYNTLDQIAKTSGSGSIERKINLLAKLVRKATPIEAKYIVRTVMGRLRLGIADMTILDGLATIFGGIKIRPILERAYNLSSDLGAVAEAVAGGGLEAVKRFQVQFGRPIRPMLAERLRSPIEILKKMGGECIAEYKYDGERVQIHKWGTKVLLFSRRLENITKQFPDVIELARNYLKVNKTIVEAEIVATNPLTGELRPFQELMRRRRKYGIEQAMRENPVALFFFDCLFLDGQDLTRESYLIRHRLLAKIVKQDDRTRLATSKMVKTPKALHKFFQQAIEEGCEGVVCKATYPEAVYQAGARGWLWIKYKREYRSEMTDTVDLVIVGAFYGRGKRAGVYGSLLLAAYDPEADSFKTVTKLGAGFSDEELTQLPKRLEPYRIEHKHPRVISFLKADAWFVPSLVLEVTGAEITLSPVHVTAWGKIREDTGLAVRFPRFTGHFREDKAPEDATTEQEIIEMYKQKLKKY
jgi:DNA ligase-1